MRGFSPFIVAASAITVATPAHAQAVELALKAQPLAVSLNQLALQSRRQILFAPALVEGRMAPALSGVMAAEDALQKLLHGTGLRFRSEGNVLLIEKEPAAKFQRTAAAQVGDPAPEPVERAETGGVEDIVVTAQRRSENLQKVPLAITAITSAEMASSGISEVQQLVLTSPGVTLNTDRYALVPYIRGIGSQNTTPGDEGAVSIYVDNVLYAEAGANVFSFNNIERVEVLRGPQGTLFGRNALGGLINIITRKPSETPALEGTVSYGNYDTIRGSVYATTGLAEGVAMDLAVSGVRQGDGWGYNKTLGIDVNRNKEISLRSKLLAELGATTKVTLAGDYTKGNSDIGVSRGPRKGTLASGGLGNAGFYDISTEDPPLGRKEQYGASATIDQDLGFADLTSITAYRHYNLDIRGDADGTAAFITVTHLPMRNKTFQQEFVLNGSTGILNWTAGLFYFTSAASYDQLAVVATTAARSFSLFSKQTTHSYAGYAQGNFKLSPSTNLTAGLRYTIDERAIDAQRYLLAHYPDTAPGALTTTTDNLPHSDTHSTFKKLTWRLALDHQITQQMLTYASFSRGFKSGIYATAAPFNAVVKPSTLDAYEIGMKSDFFDRTLRLNLAAFYYDYDNIQLQAINPGFVGAFVLNAASAKSKGIDFEMVWAPRLDDGKLQIRTGASFLDAKYRNFPNSVITTPLPGGGNLQTSGDASGNRMIQAPKFTSSVGVDYSHPIGSDGSIDFNTTWLHNGGFFWDSQNRVKESAYEVVNARLGYSGADRRWSIAAFARNLLNEKYYASMSPQTNGDIAIPAAPRTYGIELGFKFGG